MLGSTNARVLREHTEVFQRGPRRRSTQKKSKRLHYADDSGYDEDDGGDDGEDDVGDGDDDGGDGNDSKVLMVW